MGTVKIAVFNDTCGNNIQIVGMLWVKTLPLSFRKNWFEKSYRKWTGAYRRLL